MILVTGGTGLVGAHLLYELSKKHDGIRATFRNEDKIKLVKKVFSYYTDEPETLFEKIEWIQANVLNVQALKTAFAGVNRVYHAAAMVSFDPSDDQTLLSTNIEGTSNVVNLCVTKGIEKLCFVSSIAALGPSTNGIPVTEENEWTNNPTTYSISKHYAEMEVWRASQEGVPVVIVNPGVIIAPGFWKNSSGSFFHLASKGPKYYLPTGTGFVGVNDVTKAMIQLMESSVVNERFILVNQNWTYKKFAELLAKGLDKVPPKKEIKHWMLGLFWRLDWLRSKIFGKRRRLTKNTAHLFKSWETYDHSKIKEAIGFEFEDLKKSTLRYCAIFLREREP